jgi:hypothetical protein
VIHHRLSILAASPLLSLLLVSPVAVARGAGRVAPPVVYVASPGNNTIYIFGRDGKAAGQITNGIDGPAGLYVDPRHDLWVANPGANDVLMYPRGANSPSVTLEDTNAPNDVAQCPDGTTYVADSAGAGGIGVYPAGRTKPARRLGQFGSHGGFFYYATCDSTGNVFAVGIIDFSPVLATTGWTHGKESGYYLLPIYNFFAAGIIATKSGALLVSNSLGSGNSQPAVVEYTEAGKATGRAVATASTVWTGLAYDQKRDVVYGAAERANIGASLQFPSGGRATSYTTAGLAAPQGIAFDPGS